MSERLCFLKLNGDLESYLKLGIGHAYYFKNQGCVTTRTLLKYTFLFSMVNEASILFKSCVCSVDYHFHYSKELLKN